MEFKEAFKINNKKVLLIGLLLFITLIIFILYGITQKFCGYNPNLKITCEQSTFHNSLGLLLNIFALPVFILEITKGFINNYVIALLLVILLETAYFYIILSVIYLFKKRF